MANQLFSGFLYTDAGVAINGATVDLFDRNTTTPVRATTTTNANGYWAISHATEGRFDVRITNGSSIRWRKYDTQEQIDTLEVANFRIRNPADTFDYDIVPAAITADRTLNLPLLAATDTIAVLAMAQTFLTGAKTFNDNILAVRNPADTFSYSIRSSAITAARDLTLPLITGTDTLASLGLAQTFLATITFSANDAIVFSHADGGNLTASSPTGSLVLRGQKTAANTGTAMEIRTLNNVDSNTSRLTITGGVATAVWTFLNSVLSVLRVQDDAIQIENPAATFIYTLTGGAITASRILNLPVITATDTIAVATLDSQSLPGLLHSLLKQYTILPIPTNTGWTEALVGAGSTTTQKLTGLEFYVTTTNNASAKLSALVQGLEASGTQNWQAVAWNHKLSMRFGLWRATTNAAGTGRFQLKQTSAIGALAAQGIGVRVDGVAVVGESYGTALGTVSLGVNLGVNNEQTNFLIVHDPDVPEIKWYTLIDGVATLRGTQSTAANIPTTVPSGGDTNYLVGSWLNGATGIDSRFGVMTPLISQAI